MRAQGILLLLCLGLGACAAQTPSPQATASASAPAGMQRIDVKEGDSVKFSFNLPAEFKEQQVQGEDSLVKSYKSETATLNLDYGGYSDPLTGYNQRSVYTERTTTIDKKQAKIISFYDQGQASAGVYFSDVGPQAGTKLTMFIQGSDKNLVEVAEKIFSSVDFP